MKRLRCVLPILFGFVAMTAPASAGSGERSVTGAMTGVLGAGAALGPVALQRVEVDTGVLIEADGSAWGTFHAELQGSLLGLRRQITLEGKASAGSVATDGRAIVSGTASLDLGDGTPPLPTVPFILTAGPAGVVLAIDSITLPVATLTSGAVVVE